VPGILGNYLARCWICSHAHSSWQERKEHAKWDSAKEHFAFLAQNAVAPQAQLSLAGGEDDDDDDDGDDHDDRDNADEKDDDPEEDRSNEHEEDASSDSSGYGHGNDNHQADETPDEDTDHIFSEFLKAWSGSWGYPSSVRLVSLQDRSSNKHDRSANLGVQWLRRLEKGGTASVFRVQMLDHNSSTEGQTYIVKQYDTQHRELFEREVEAFTILQGQAGSSSAFLH
jgi:hypothetical protein